MKENDMLEQMFSAVAQLLGQREEAMLERIEALEKKVEELERKLEEVPVVEIAGDEDPVEEEVAVEQVEMTGGYDEVVEDENVVDEAAVAVEVEEMESEEVEYEEDGSEEPASEPEMEIELEFFDEEEDESMVEEVNVEDEIEEVQEVAESDDNDGPVLVVDKARPDWYDWEVDIPGSYIEDIWDGIGLNDRLLFLKELFRGDEIDFSETLDALNEMATLVEAVEYIRGRYPFWDEESDEVYRFYMTVRRRFNKQRQEI